MGLFRKDVSLTADEQAEVQEAVKAVTMFGDPIKQRRDDVLEMEVAKVAIATMLDPKNLNSTTNMDDEQLWDFADARSLNAIYKCPLVEDYIRDVKESLRSQTEDPISMMKTISDIVGRALPQDNKPKSIWDRFRH